jgi:hypothetical protein
LSASGVGREWPLVVAGLDCEDSEERTCDGAALVQRKLATHVICMPVPHACADDLQQTGNRQWWNATALMAAIDSAWLGG